jgi:hypothetical protein
MNLENWAFFAEIVSSVAILATLGYLAIQTRQNSRALLANSRNTLISTDLAVLHQAIDNPTIGLSRYKTNHTPEELAQLESWLIGLIRTREHQWFQYRDGLLDKKVWEAYSTAIPYVLRFPIERAFWEYVKDGFFDREFVAEIDRRLSDMPMATDLRPTIERALEASGRKVKTAD